MPRALIARWNCVGSSCSGCCLVKMPWRSLYSAAGQPWAATYACKPSRWACELSTGAEWACFTRLVASSMKAINVQRGPALPTTRARCRRSAPVRPAADSTASPVVGSPTPPPRLSRTAAAAAEAAAPIAPASASLTAGSSPRRPIVAAPPGVRPLSRSPRSVPIPKPPLPVTADISMLARTGHY